MGTPSGNGNSDEQRIGRLEAQVWDIQKVQWNNVARITSLETSRDNERTRHASTPSWLFGAISAAVAIMALLFNLYLAGLKP